MEGLNQEDRVVRDWYIHLCDPTLPENPTVLNTQRHQGARLCGATVQSLKLDMTRSRCIRDPIDCNKRRDRCAHVSHVRLCPGVIMIHVHKLVIAPPGAISVGRGMGRSAKTMSAWNVCLCVCGWSCPL